jgi:hypothetical protein
MVSKKIPSRLSGESSTVIPLTGKRASWDEFKALLRSLWQRCCSEIKPKPPKDDTEPAKENTPPAVEPAQSSHSESLFHVKKQTFPISRKQPVQTKLIIAALGAFILTGLFPPWQFTTDTDSVNGGKRDAFSYQPPSQGVHSRKPAGYSLLFTPPTNPDTSAGNGVQIDFGRLSLEWALLAAITGIVWLLVVKPARSREDMGNRSQKFISPPENSEN